MTVTKEPDPKLNELTEATIGAAIEVHRILGPGLVESVYEEALCIELGERDIPFQRQVPISHTYKDQPVGIQSLDLLVGGVLIVELKAVEQLAPIHTAQLISYLRAMKLSLGLLITFNVRLLRQGLRRVVLTCEE